MIESYKFYIRHSKFLPIYGMNLQVFPSSGKGLGPGTSSQGFTDGDRVSNTEATACVDLAR